MTTAPRHIPTHERLVFAPRRSRYALVIPVINEGERIRRQLERIADLGLDLDVIIADGGSTDGSLATEFLAQVGVRALLTKTGPGKLSAQLRMAYAFVLDEGYDGVITCDGNGKDEVGGIPRFIAALDEGYDYAQGTRYAKGGRGINTPFVRKVAGRLVHAPILSVAARRWYTDTTNGFRAYSSRYLNDPRVQPFRAEFDRYGLLFYLTVRAPQLRLRTVELGVERRYPASGRTPTKIVGLRGHWAMLAEVIAVALGRRKPR